HRRHELPHEVASRLVSRARQIADLTRPQQIAVGMLGCQHDVASTRLVKQLRPVVRHPLPRLALEDGLEVFVGEMLAEGAVVVRASGSVVELQAVEIPLRVRILAEVRVEAALGDDAIRIFSRGRPARYGVKTPVNEDPELRVLIPVRQRMSPDRFERRFVMLRLGCHKHSDFHHAAMRFKPLIPLAATRLSEPRERVWAGNRTALAEPDRNGARDRKSGGYSPLDPYATSN